MAEKQSEAIPLTDSTDLPRLAPIPPPPQTVIDNIVKAAPNPPTNILPPNPPKK